MNERESSVDADYTDRGWKLLRRGWPDFLAVRGSEVVALEVKPLGGKLSAAQEEMREALELAGLKYRTVKPHPRTVDKQYADPSSESALYDKDAPSRILAASGNETDWGLAWLMLNQGMHPEQIRRLSPDALSDTGILVWRRVKNGRPMRDVVPKADVARLRDFIRTFSAQPLTREAIWKRVKALAAKAGYKAGPRVLRKTFILNELRKYNDRPDCIDFVAARAGCTRAVVITHYISLDQWEKASSPSERRS